MKAKNELKQDQARYSIMLGIFYTKSNGDIIYGALRVTPTKFLHKMDSLSGYVYVTESMLDEIVARFKDDNLSTEILEQAKNEKINQYELKQDQARYSTMLRILYTKSNGDKIYGALRVTPTKFLHKMDSLSGDVYATESMLDEIIARFKDGNLSTEILEQAKNEKINQYELNKY